MNLSMTANAAIWLKAPCAIIRLRPVFAGIIVLDVRMDAFPNKEAVQVAAQKEGKSVTEYIIEAVRLRMEQENAASGTPGVVENLKGDTDPVE